MINEKRNTFRAVMIHKYLNNLHEEVIREMAYQKQQAQCHSR
jgi:hypothetical protein